MRSGTNADRHRANPLGAYVATLGALILLISVFLHWVGLGPADNQDNLISGYEADGVIPFMGFFGLGFALALLYATMRADRRQHRGLSLASMAVGLASFLWILFFLFDPISTFQYKRERHHRVRRLHRPAGRADLDRGLVPARQGARG